MTAIPLVGWHEHQITDSDVAGRDRGGNARHRIFNGQALVGVDIQYLAGMQIYRGSGLLVGTGRTSALKRRAAGMSGSSPVAANRHPAAWRRWN